MKNQIKSLAASFISEMPEPKAWNQEAHCAFVAYAVKRILKDDLGTDDAEAELSIQAVAEKLLEISTAMPSFLCNASAFRQWLESKDVALLPKSAESTKLGNRYGGLV